MNIRDQIKLYGGILLLHSEIPEPIYIENVVCSVGKQRCASHLASYPSTNYWFSHLAIGTGVSEASTEDLALDDEFYRVQLDSVYAEGYIVYGSVTLTGLLIDAYLDVTLGSGDYDITEFGLLDAMSGGNLICRQKISVQLGLTGAESLEVLWGVIVT
jgi:hypothetical protein